MKKSNYKPQIPDLMEAVFDAVYLTFDLAAAALFFLFSKGNILYVLYGILTLTLCGGSNTGTSAFTVPGLCVST